MQKLPIEDVKIQVNPDFSLKIGSMKRGVILTVVRNNYGATYSMILAQEQSRKLPIKFVWAWVLQLESYENVFPVLVITTTDHPCVCICDGTGGNILCL